MMPRGVATTTVIVGVAVRLAGAEASVTQRAWGALRGAGRFDTQ